MVAVQNSDYQLSLSPRLFVLTVLFASVTCFGFGSLARWVLLTEAGRHQHQQYPLQSPLQSQSATPTGGSLPPLFVAPHKPIPRTRYTSKHYDTGLSVSSDTLLSSNRNRPTTMLTSTDASKAIREHDDDDDDEEEIHEPAGQHLLVDIANVDGAFLNSEHHLAQAMIDLVDMSGLTMLSYHCHKLLPAGVSCAGVLLESHVSFHTWPVQGVITLDLFTCGPNSLLNLLNDVQALFAIPDSTTAKTPQHQLPKMVWAWKRRGFPTDEGYTPGISDLGTTLLGVLQFPKKEQITFFQTPFQSVHIYNVLDPRYSYNISERRMYLDGILQARERGQAANAEALVHPALLTHSNPRKVTIVGGGDGAALREVLKHASVTQVEWAEIDQAVVEISQEWLWSQCDDFLEHVSSCLEDPRVTLYYEDGFKWFQKRYGNRTDAAAPSHSQDIIILDVLNPEDEVDFSEVFFDDLAFAQVLHDALDDDGILAVPLGAGRSLSDPPEQWTRAHHVAKLVANLEQVGFAAIYEYEDSHTGKLEIDTNSFLVAFKHATMEWFATEAQMEVKMHERMMRTQTGQLPLKYFDGAIMQSYQMPSRASEVMFCRNQNIDCQHGLDPMVRNVPLASLGIVKETGEVVASQRIDQGTMVGMEQCVHKLDVHAASLLVSKENIAIGSSDQESLVVTDVYNPFSSRTAFTRACVDKCTTRNTVAAGEKIEGVTAFVARGRGDNSFEDIKDAPRVESPPGSNETADKNHPNYTDAAAAAEDNCSENLETGKRECLAAGPQAAIYETTVTQLHQGQDDALEGIA
jgi:S-adenosylmethionine decarboxylase proenzyme